MPTRKATVGAVFLTVVVDLVGFGIVMPLMPLYARDYHATPQQIGLLIAIFSAMQFLFAPVWGLVSDRIGRRPVLLVGLLGSVGSYLLFGLADSVTWLFVSRIGAGISGANISTAAAYIADVTPPKDRARGMALIGAAFGIGFTAGPVIGLYSHHLGETLVEAGGLPPAVGRGLPGFIAALMSLLAFLWTWFSVAEPPRHAPASRRLFDLAALRTAYSPAAVLLLLGFSFVSVFSFSNFEGTLSLMLVDRYHLTEAEMGPVWLFLGVTLSLAQGLLVRRLARSLGERVLVRGGLVLMATGLAGLAACSGQPALYASLAIAVTGFGAVTPSLSALVSRQADPTRHGGMMGMAQSASALGRILGPYVGNVVYARPGTDAGALGAVLLPLFAGVDHHRRPYLLGAALLGLLAVAAMAALPGPPPDPGPDGGSGTGSGAGGGS